ncbi:MAG TPA: tyrosine-type recombinase/integrase, partial [Candidatus Wunengus sp. YC61]|uniref:tyrosine-type recombinase/integrase n=1 Tax=Candidatus Wunengus sp. YC61 TaxID=3367698 RepID=UPI004024F397
TQAVELLEEIRGNIRRQIFGLPIKRQIPTLGEYARIYLDLCKSEKENTFSMKRTAIKALTRYLGDYPLDKITPFIVERYRIERKEKDGVQDSSINIDFAILSHIFTVAIKAGIVEKNPCKEVKKLKITQTKDRILNQSEIALLLDKLQGKDRLMILTALLTGLRLGGVLGLSWNDIDFNNGIISSSHKTGKLVSIPLSDCLRNALEAYRTHATGDRVFENREIAKDVVVKYSDYFSKLFKGLGIHDFTFHNLRHTFSSLLQGELGIGAVVVQGMTGHSSLSMLQKYSHTGMGNKRTAIQALDSYVSNTGQKVNLAMAQ